MEIPYIDLSGIDGHQTRTIIARELATLSRTSGWAVLINHSNSRTYIEQMTQVAGKLCDMPVDQQKMWPLGKNTVGYETSHGPGVATVYVSGRPGSLDQQIESLPPLWQRHVEQIETFTFLCHALTQKLLVCLGLAINEDDYEALAKEHLENAEGTVQFRVRRHSPSSVAARHADSTVWLPSSPTGSIIIGFMAEGLVEVDMANGEWRSVPGASDGILVYVGDAVPFWSRGHLQNMRYCLAWSDNGMQTEKIKMTYLSATAPGYDFGLGCKQARTEKS
ncbi:hypothetical protein LTR10_003329 [Elasticomyces elasticus]|nr:hypothetical protein LTR10_003329 [Elasticomyces elasticus]KAK4969599.1 hypothetical protein LTR42_008871 [Elasticomyces elasticus]